MFSESVSVDQIASLYVNEMYLVNGLFEKLNDLKKNPMVLNLGVKTNGLVIRLACLSQS
jgi:hypothetical protein